MEIQAGSRNGHPKIVHTMEIHARSHNGGSNQFTQWRSKPWRSDAGSHNGGSSRFTQWRFKPVHTMEIQSRFTQ